MQVISDPKPQERLQKAEPVVTKADLAKQAATATPVVPPPKVDYATDLFNLLSMDDSGQNDSQTSPVGDTMWASFQCMFLVIFFFKKNYHRSVFFHFYVVFPSLEFPLE